MKSKILKSIFVQFISYWIILPSFTYSQIVISPDELPSVLGTILASSHDTTEHAIVDVGSPGANQSWTFTQAITGIEIITEVVDLHSTPFAADFPNADWVIKYSDGLLDLIYSDVFPQIKGDVYFYQNITPTNVEILGTGFVSSFVSGAALFEPPNVILELLPTQYEDSWVTYSIFTISKDTTIFGIPGTLTLTVNDSAYSAIDAWGQVTVPLGTYDCLRMKSYVFMDEKVTFNGATIKTKVARIINYNWLVEDLGLLVRVASHTAEFNDNFTDARLFTRLDRVDALPVGVSPNNHHNSIEPPDKFILFQNYPNPFNPITSISYSLPEKGRVILKIYNILGNEIKIIENAAKGSGFYTSNWDGTNKYGTNVTSGIYIYHLEFISELDLGGEKTFSLKKKMILTK